MKDYNEVVKFVLERRDEYAKKRKKRILSFISLTATTLCCCAVFTLAIGVWMLVDDSTHSGEPFDGTEAGVVDVPTGTDETSYIDSLDKLNFYAVKKTISDIDFAGGSLISPLSSRTVAKSLSTMIDSKTVEIDPNSTFTITMCTYFTANITNTRGFLAHKLGGTGQVEVVITQNNLSNMITFKKGDEYYSCLQSGQTDSSMTFSTSGYVDGFTLVQNHDQENFSFTVSFDGDRVIGISAARVSSNVDSYMWVVDNIKMKDNFAIVVYKEESFTIESIEEMFRNSSNDIPFVDEGVVMKDGSVLFGKSSLSSKRKIALVRNGRSVIENEDIKSVKAMYSDKIGYYVSLEMINSTAFKGAGYAVLYIDGVQHREVTLKGEGKVVNIINLVNKANVSDVFYDLTVNETSNKIGKILDHDDFLREIPKRVDLDNYSVNVFSENNSAYYRKTDNDLDLGRNSYQMTVDGITFSLPIKLSDFINLGFSMQASRIDAALFEGTADFTTPSGNKIQVNVTNLYNDAKTIKDAYVKFVYFICYDNWYNAQHGIAPEGVDFEFFGNVNKYSTLDQILTDFGEPNVISFFFDNINKVIVLKYELNGPSTPSGYITFMLYTPLHSGTVTSYIESVSIGLDK